MTESARQGFLAEPHVGIVAVERADGPPLAVPVWYSYEPGGQVSFSTGIGSIKEVLIRAAGRFTLTAQVEEPPYRYVSVSGSVASIDPATPEELLAIAVRYLGEEGGAHFHENEDSALCVIVRLNPERWLSTDYS